MRIETVSSDEEEDEEHEDSDFSDKEDEEHGVVELYVPSEILTVTERHVTGGDEIDFFSLCRGSLVSFEVFFTSKNFITSSLTKFV